MQLHERLMDLLGHEVSVAVQDGDPGKSMASGVLKEVGPDYLIIGPRRRAEAPAPSAPDWWIRVPVIAAIIHQAGCPRCASPDS